MKNVIKMSLATAVMMSVGTLSAQGADGISIVDNIKVKGEIRPRYERVDTDNTTGSANALTNRLKLGVSADLLGTDWLSVYGEMIDVSNVNENYNSSANGNPNGDNIVADPEQTRLTQAYLDVKYKKTLLRAGRQMVNIDNQRFVGAVGWRQMPQTFNAVALVDNTFENLNLTAAYVTQVNRVFASGTASPSDNFNTKSVILNAKYKVMDELSVTGYSYMIGSIHDTHGVALTGNIPMSEGMKLSYRAEYALQDDASIDAKDFYTGKPNADADYLNLEVGVKMDGLLAGLNYEVLSGTSTGSNKTAFSTPLATGHKFNGWADKFLATPTAGLVDANVMVGYKSKDLGVAKAIYHDFSSDVGSTDYGTELDLLYKRAIPGVKNLTGMLKAAFYDGGDSVASGNTTALATDTSKFWVMLDYKFSN